MPITYRLEGEKVIGNSLLIKIAKTISSVLKIEDDYKIGVSFVDEKTIKSLNNKYADNDYATDVLSFEYGKDNNDGNIGDVAICQPIAEKQAEEFGTSIESECVLLLIHGTLHVLGLDHQNPEQSSSMDKLQGDIMKTLNYQYRNFKWYH